MNPRERRTTAVMRKPKERIDFLPKRSSTKPTREWAGTSIRPIRTMYTKGSLLMVVPLRDSPKYTIPEIR